MKLCFGSAFRRSHQRLSSPLVDHLDTVMNKPKLTPSSQLSCRILTMTCNMFDFSGNGNNPVIYLDPSSGTQVSTPPST